MWKNIVAIFNNLRWVTWSSLSLHWVFSESWTRVNMDVVNMYIWRQYGCCYDLYTQCLSCTGIVIDSIILCFSIQFVSRSHQSLLLNYFVFNNNLHTNISCNSEANASHFFENHEAIVPRYYMQDFNSSVNFTITHWNMLYKSLYSFKLKHVWKILMKRFLFTDIMVGH